MVMIVINWSFYHKSCVVNSWVVWVCNGIGMYGNNPETKYTLLFLVQFFQYWVSSEHSQYLEMCWSQPIFFSNVRLAFISSIASCTLALHLRRSTANLSVLDFWKVLQPHFSTRQFGERLESFNPFPMWNFPHRRIPSAPSGPSGRPVDLHFPPCDWAASHAACPPRRRRSRSTRLPHATARHPPPPGKLRLQQTPTGIQGQWLNDQKHRCLEIDLMQRFKVTANKLLFSWKKWRALSPDWCFQARSRQSTSVAERWVLPSKKPVINYPLSREKDAMFLAQVNHSFPGKAAVETPQPHPPVVSRVGRAVPLAEWICVTILLYKLYPNLWEWTVPPSSFFHHSYTFIHHSSFNFLLK